MKYIKPDFDVTKFEVEDILTTSSPDSMFTPNDPDGDSSNGESWDD